MTRTFDVSSVLDDDIISALEVLDDHFRSAGVQYLLVGALARDVVTSLAQGRLPQRATKDIDLAVEVSSMEQFRTVTEDLERVGRHAHKFLVRGLEIDIVPFGGLEQAGAVHFRESTLDVSGLAEAAEHSDLVRVTPSLTVSTASVVALCLLKVLAWRDRKGWTDKDAVDLAALFDAVALEPYEEDMWADEVAGDIVDYDGSFMGAAWLGREAGRLAKPHSFAAVEKVLMDFDAELAQDMKTAGSSDMIAAFLAGLQRCRE